MTPREQFIHALERREPVPGSRVPHFELVNFLTMELFGMVHPLHRDYAQWVQMEERERELHRADMADVYVRTAERFDWSALLLMAKPWGLDEHLRLVENVRRQSGDSLRRLLFQYGPFSLARSDCRVCDTILESADSRLPRARLLHHQAH